MTFGGLGGSDGEDEERRILDAYGVRDPRFAFILGGFRRIAVNPEDARARRMLLKRGLRYFSGVQSFIFLALDALPVDLYLDIGTNYGECAFAAPLYSKTRIVGYEANESLHRYLERSKSYNDDIGTIDFVHSAVSSRAGETLTFYIDNAWSGKSSVVHDKKKKNQTKVVVPATSVDHEVDRLGGLRELLLLKVDVEGYEPAVFEGAKNAIATTPNVVCLMEFDSKYLTLGGTDPADFFRRLQNDFEIYQLDSVLQPVTAYEQLGTKGESGIVHTNLVLRRFRDASLVRLFDDRVAAQNLKNAAAKAWR